MLPDYTNSVNMPPITVILRNGYITGTTAKSGESGAGRFFDDPDCLPFDQIGQKMRRTPGLCTPLMGEP